MTNQATIFNVQRFSTHDGPGIRTTVFFKGCPLKCLWCANPESQDPKPQLMTRDVKCVGCGECAEACPENAITISKDKGRQIDWEHCTNCFQCVDTCIYGALTKMGEEQSVESIVEIVEKDKVFYKNSGGGVTLSGGEALVQHGFLARLLPVLRDKGFHITLDTTGYASYEALEKLIPFLDLIMFDIKHLDTVRHKELAGVDNDLILENITKIAPKLKTWFRIPLISDINDSKEHMTKVAKLAANLDVEKISLLPFHEGGIAKWAQTGKTAPDFNGQEPSEEYMNNLLEIISSQGMSTGIRS
jgi:pyruvate formate lyase activating enzyme